MSDVTKEILVKVNLETGSVDNNIKEINSKLSSVGQNINTDTFKSLKTQIREATVEAQRLGQQFGTNSKEFTVAAQRVANLKDQFSDTNDIIKGFNPDNKLQGLIGIASGAASAVQGIAGAFTLVGVNAETANETIAKLQGLIALTDAISQIDNIKNSFTALTGVLKTSVIPSLFTLRGALIATGVGAFLVVLGLVISKFQEMKQVTDEATEAQKSLNQARESYVNSFYSNQEKLELALAKQRGDNERQQFEIKKKYGNLTIKDLQEKLKEQEDISLFYRNKSDKDSQEKYRAALAKSIELEAQIDKLRTDLRVAEIELNTKSVTKVTTSVAKSVETAFEKVQKFIKETREKIATDNLSEYDKEIFEVNKTFDEYRKLAKGNYKQLAELHELYLLTLESLNKKYNVIPIPTNPAEFQKRLKDELNNADNNIDLNVGLSEEDILKAKANILDLGRTIKGTADISKQDFEALGESGKTSFDKLSDNANNVSKVLQSVGQGFSIFSDLISAFSSKRRKEGEEGKKQAIKEVKIQEALSIGQIAINTAEAVAKSIAKSPTTFGAPWSIFSLAQGVAQTIVARKNAKQAIEGINNGGGAGGSLISTPSINAVAPSINTTSINTQPQNVRVINQGDQTVRAYIVDRDLQTNQERQSFLNKLSSF